MNLDKYMSHAVVSLISAKGGVGTSTLTKELAIAFSKNVSVCLVDMKCYTNVVTVVANKI